MAHKKNIVVIGGGFAGINFIKTIQNFLPQIPDYQVVLVNKHSYQLYTPALYEIAAVPEEFEADSNLSSTVTIPISEMFQGEDVKLIKGECIEISDANKNITLASGEKLNYEFLILAVGAETNYFNIPGLEEESTGLKTLTDALKIRKELESLLKLNKKVVIVVGGGGASGVELASELQNFACKVNVDIEGEENKSQAIITIVEAAPNILPGFSPYISRKALARLNDLGIIVETEKRVSSVKNKIIKFDDGGEKKFDIFIWTGGVRGMHKMKNSNLPLSPKGLLYVDEYLRVIGNKNIFAIGDIAAFTQTHENLRLGNVPVAEEEAKFAAKNVALAAQNKTMEAFIASAKKFPYVLAVGKKFAIADLLWIKFSGYLGWIIKQLVELRYLIGILPFPEAWKQWREAVRAYSSND